MEQIEVRMNYPHMHGQYQEFPKIIPLTLVISFILKQNEQTKGPAGAKKMVQ